MNSFKLTVMLFMLGIMLSVQFAKAESVTDETALNAVATAFAASHLLGTGGDQYVSSVSVLSDDTGMAIIGATDGDGDDPNAYKAYFEKISEDWKLIRYEYIFRPTGEKVIETMNPPFPAPYWDKLISQQ